MIEIDRWLYGRSFDSMGDLWGLLESSLKGVGECVAVEDPGSGGSVTASDLLRTVEVQGARMSQAGARPGDRVLMDLPPSIEEIVYVLACVRQGLVYVGVDPRGTTASAREVARDSAPTLVVTSRPDEWDTIPSITPHGDGQVEQVPAATCSDPDTCYISYTSGTTGKPKGVEIPRGAVERLILGADYCELTLGDRFLRYAPLAFDASTLEIFVPIWRSATLVIGPTTPLDLTELADFLNRERLHSCWLTAGLFSALVSHSPTAFRGMQRVLTGGDRVPAASVSSALLANPHLEVVNGYGPTESTTFATVKAMTADSLPTGSVPIGAPIAGTSVAIATDGELLITGRGLAKGYWNDPSLTLERFPIVEGHRAYRSGDLVEVVGGELRFLGRKDRQLKVRGHRVQPEAVDEKLRMSGVVEQCWTFGTQEVAAAMLVCAYVAQTEVSESRLKELLLASGLPLYSVPSRFLRVGQLPLSTNGKVDEKALTSLLVANAHSDGLEADVGAATEQSATGIVRSAWRDVLGLPDFDDDDGFFEVGGDSLRLAKLHSLLVERFPESDLRLVDLFNLPTVRLQAEKLRRGSDV